MKYFLCYLLTIVVAALIACNSNGNRSTEDNKNSASKNDTLKGYESASIDSLLGGYNIIDSVKIDFNSDDLSDYIIIASLANSSTVKEVIILLNEGDGKYRLIGKNSKLLFMEGDQGRLGDSYCGILTNKNSFEICQNIDAGNGLKNTYFEIFAYEANKIELKQFKVVRTKVKINSSSDDPLEIPKEKSDTSIFNIQEQFEKVDLQNLLKR
jgi:hypothetical protein